MKIVDIISIFTSQSRLNEMASRQGAVIDDMEGFAFQIAAHITKLLNSLSASEELKSKWVRDITKHCNLLHKEHQNNGRTPIQFQKKGNYSRLIDHSVAKLQRELVNYDDPYVDRESEYSNFLLKVLRFSQDHYNQQKPFTHDWVAATLLGE